MKVDLLLAVVRRRRRKSVRVTLSSPEPRNGQKRAPGFFGRFWDVSLSNRAVPGSSSRFCSRPETFPRRFWAFLGVSRFRNVSGTRNVSCPAFPCNVGQMCYAYAKTLAEKTAWQVARERGLNLVVVNPSFVVGTMGGYQDRYVGFVHTEDVVAAHVLAMEESRVVGRLICSSSVAHWADIISMLKAKYPQYPFESKPITQHRDKYKHS